MPPDLPPTRPVPSDPVPWDPGLQPERTTLAWIRTGLGVVVVCLLTSRLAGESGLLAAAVALGGSTVAVLLVAMEARRFRRRDAALRSAPEVPAALGAVGGLTALVLALVAVSLLLVAVPALDG